MKPKKFRKSQIKMGENIAILFIFFFILGFGLIFYGKFTSVSVKSQGEENMKVKAVQIAQRISYLPETRCSEMNVVRSDCYDILKIVKMAELAETNKIFYYDLLEYSNVTIKEIYPGNADYKIYDNPLPDKKYGIIPINIPITLYNAISDRMSYGILTVGVYVKTKQ